MNGHLVAVEVGVEGGADQRMDLDGLAFDEHRLEGLDAETVKRRRAVQENRMLLDDLFERVPHFGPCSSTISLAALIVPTRPFCSRRL